MVFIRPTAFWLLLLVVPLIAMHYRQHTGLGRLRVVSVASLRVLTFLLLVLALARPVIERGGVPHTTVAVVDVSGSVEAAELAVVEKTLADRAARAGENERLELVTFDAVARQVQTDGDGEIPAALASIREGKRSTAPGSALTEALSLASALIPQDGHGSVLLHTDGLATDGDAYSAALRLAERGITVSASPMGNERVNEVILRSVLMPASEGIGATVELIAEIAAASECPGELVVRCENTGDVSRVPLDLRAGRQSVVCSCPLQEQGVNTYSVSVVAETDTRGENNDLAAAIYVEPPAEVRVVEDVPDAPASVALGELLGLAANVRPLPPTELSAADSLTDVDVLVIADTPAQAIAGRDQLRIAQAVTDGMGLLVAGGRRAFGPGGYADTPIADVLPLRFSERIERRDPSTTLVVIIDTSGSMGGARVNLAKEIARLAIARLKPHDKVGIVEFYGTKRWAAPIQPASNALDVQRALNRLSAGGGTIILPAIEEAYYALQNVRTRTKHVLVLTDGGVEPGAFEPLIRRMSESGTTLSTVMVGPGGHSAFLSSLAQWGRGRFYAAPDRFNLPEVIVKQPESSLLTPFVEQPTTLVRSREQRAVRDIDFTAAPQLQGYVETEARSTADVLVTSNLGHPVLALWQHGLGHVAAYTSEIAGAWTHELAGWPGYGRMFSNIARSLCRPRAANALCIVPTVRPGVLEVEIENRRPGDGEAFAPVELVVSDGTGSERRFTLDPVQPHRWNVRVPDLPPGTYAIEARTSDGVAAGAGAAVVPPVREVTALRPDQEFFDGVAQMQSLAARRAAALSTGGAVRLYELWPPLVGAALVLLLTNVLVRRLPTRVRTARSARTVAVLVLLFGPLLPAAIAQDAAPALANASSHGLPAGAIELIQRALAAPGPDPVEEYLEQASRIVQARDGQLDDLVAYLEVRGDDAMAQYCLARVAQWNGDLEKSKNTLRGLVDREQATSAVWAELGRIEEMTGRSEAALDALDRAIATESAADRQFALRLRRALLSYEAGDAAAAQVMLRAIVTERGSEPVKSYCAHIAALWGDFGLAAELLVPAGSGKKRFHDHQFRGLFLLRCDRLDEALREFEHAYEHATLSRDRRYALERIVATARRAGRLSQLADGWLAQPGLSVDRLDVLVTILRELGRSDDALALLRRPDWSEEQKARIESTDFQRELIAVAVEAGKETEAEETYRGLLERDPAHVEWRVGLARLLLVGGRREAAEALFHEGVDRFDKPGLLLLLADGARRLSLDEPALAAARKAGEGGDKYRVRAVLFEADLVRHRGDADKAVAMLKDVCTLAEADPNLLLEVAGAFERYGDKVQALRLLRKLYAATGGEDLLLRIAWLLEQERRFDEAYALWKEMWQTTENATRLRQAQERLLDLASRTGTLADLAIELEERLDEGGANERELALLVDLYTVAQDAISASEILHAFGRQSGDTVDVLKRLSRVYLSCEQFGRCNATLRRLVELDPENAEDYLQQIAIVALERRRPIEARAVLAELETRATDPAVTDEFAAGVLNQVGLHEEAARAYGRVVARHPDRIEAFLLWGNAMKGAGQAERAIARFETLVEEAEADDLFAVAVDGLLNLDASPPALRYARRRVSMRIAARPDKVFLYRLAADLLEALGDSEAMNDVLELAVVVAGERRVPLLRELMDAVRADAKTSRMIEFGQSLMALGEQMPPQVFLDLGEAMIKEGRLAAAERVFERARVDSDFSAIQQRVAGYYEQANLPGAANRIIRQLLIAEPDNTALLIRSAGLYEQTGRFESAFEEYDRAANLMLRRLPAIVASDGVPVEVDASGSSRRRRVQRAVNLTELSQYFETAGDGLLNAARTDALRERLLRELLQRCDEELEAAGASRLAAPAIARSPRLKQLAAFVRQVAFALHAPDIADAFDRRLLERYPQDQALRKTVIQARLDWGLYTRAASFAETMGTDVPPPIELAAATLLQTPDRLAEDVVQGKLATDVVCRALPLLIMTGHDEHARRVLEATSLGGPADTCQAAPTMIAAAIALEEPEAVMRWAHAWLEAVVKHRGNGALAEDLARPIRLAWHHVSEPDRAALVDHLARLAEAVETEDRVRVDLMRMRLAQRAGYAFDGAREVQHAATQDFTLSATETAWVLDHAEPDARTALLRTATAARKPKDQRAFLGEIAGKLATPADDAFLSAVEELFKAAPQQRFERGRSYGMVIRHGWAENSRQPELGRRIGEVLLSESPSDIPVIGAAARARLNAGDYDGAAPLVGEALDALLATRTPDFLGRRMVTDLIRGLRPSDAEALLEDLAVREDIEGATPMSMFVRGVMLEVAGHPEAAVTAFRTAFQNAPGNIVIRRTIIMSLKRQNRIAELTRLLSRYLTKSTIMESYEWRALTDAYVALFDFQAAAKAAATDEGPLAPVGIIRIAHMNGREQDLLTALRRYVVARRVQGRFYNPHWPAPPSEEGMLAHLALKPRSFFQRVGLYEGVADFPFAEDEYRALLGAASPNRPDVHGLVQGLLRATHLNGTRPALLAALADAAARRALNTKDWRIALALAAEDANAVPPELADALYQALPYISPTDAETLGAIARAELLRGNAARAGWVLRWLVANDSLTGHSVSQMDDRFARLEAYVAALPEDTRGGEHRRWLGYLAPTPVDNLSNEFDAAWLERLAAISGAAEVKRHVDVLRMRLADEWRPGQFGDLAVAIARCDAAAGQFESFAGMVNHAIGWSRNKFAPSQPVDCHKLLPPAAELDEPTRYVDAIAGQLAAARERGELEPGACLRGLCLLGHWCAENGLRDEARGLLDRVRSEPDVSGEHSLWIADLARMVGQDDTATDVEVRLLEADRLPVVRVPALLDAVEARDGQQTADALAVHVAAYSDQPDVLKRAVRWAEAKGDSAAAANYRQRLVPAQAQGPSPQDN